MALERFVYGGAFKVGQTKVCPPTHHTRDRLTAFEKMAQPRLVYGVARFVESRRFVGEA